MGFSRNPGEFPERLSLFASFVSSHNETMAQPLKAIKKIILI